MTKIMYQIIVTKTDIKDGSTFCITGPKFKSYPIPAQKKIVNSLPNIKSGRPQH